MTPAATSRVIGLARVSTAEQELSGAGLDAQEASIRAICDQRCWQLTEIVRESASGKTLAKRPELRAILALLEDKDNPERPEALVVAKLDRLARSMLDYATMVERSQRNGWALVCLDPMIDFSTAEGRAMAQMLMIFAEFEREMIGRRTREGLAVKRSQGITLGRPRAMPQDTLTRLRSLRGEGLSYRKIAARMNDDGLKGPQGGRWTDVSVLKAHRRYGLGES